jgi:multidrug efflux system membrane fusion protein
MAKGTQAPPQTQSAQTTRVMGRVVSVLIVLYALVSGLIVLQKTNFNPRTDDAEVFANFIGIAPQVDGPIMKLHVADNQFVKKGELLLEIDERPYAYALARAKSEQAALEGQISDERRTIASQNSGVAVAEAASRSAEANVNRSAASVEEARASVSNAEAGVSRAESDLAYATNNLRRIEPLLKQQFVTVDQVDQARTTEAAHKQAVEQARSQLKLAQASLQSAIAQASQTKAALEQSHEQVQESTHKVVTLDPLTAQRTGRSSAIDTARYNLNNCRIYAPFDARVTNLTISEGHYAHTGQQIFTLIDTRTWWVIGNFRETQIKHIQPGMPADVYLLSDPTRRLAGVVDSIGFGVTPDADVIGHITQGLPDVQRTLNWVHLATRFPVRVRIQAAQPDLFRMGQSSVVVVRGEVARGDGSPVSQ